MRIVLDSKEDYVNYCYLNESHSLKYQDISISYNKIILCPIAIYENDSEYITVYFSDGTLDKVYYLAYESYKDVKNSLIAIGNNKPKIKLEIKKFNENDYENFKYADRKIIELNNYYIKNNLL